MTVTVEEALAVLEDAATSRRAQTAFSALKNEIELVRRESDSNDKQDKEGKPRFPDSTSVAEHFGDDDSAKGGNSPDGTKGSATARKGS